MLLSDTGGDFLVVSGIEGGAKILFVLGIESRVHRDLIVDTIERERRREGAMSDSDKELENQILEAGEQLTDPPSSLDELLLLLDVSLLHRLALSLPLYSRFVQCYAFSVDSFI